MKWKALFTPQGVELLEKRFLPAFEKIGRMCHLYLTPEAVYLMHNVLTSDGIQAIAQFPKDLLFSDYRLSSQNNDRVAFAVDIALLARALRSSQSTDCERLVVKLVKKSPSPTERALPYLALESRGFRAAILQDIPISQPLTRSEVAELQSSIDLVQELPRTLVAMPDLVNLQQLTERLHRCIGDGQAVQVAVMQSGALAFRTQTSAVTVATEFQSLHVWDADQGVATAVPGRLQESDSQQPGDGRGPQGQGQAQRQGRGDISQLSSRLERMLERGEAALATLNLKHLTRSLSCHMAQPLASFCGVAPHETCFLIMFQFSPSTPISLQCRLPLQLQDAP